jgi:hypothetical protein
MLALWKRNAFAAWIACLAILFSALAPSVSQALAASSSTLHQIEICTSAGIKLVSGDDDSLKKTSSDSALKKSQHCPYCSSHSASCGLLPQSAAGFALVDGHDLYPPLFYSAPQPLFSWATANPRAPPISI